MSEPSMIRMGEDEILAAPVAAEQEAAAPADDLVPSKPKRQRGKAPLPPEEVAEVTVAPRAMRPSEAKAAAIAATGDPSSDVCRWLRSQGLPAPRSLFRVSIAGGSHKDFLGLAPAEIEGVDEGEAISAYAKLRAIPLSHRHAIHFHAVLIEG